MSYRQQPSAYSSDRSSPRPSARARAPGSRPRRPLGAIEAGGGSDRDLEFILVRARGSTGGQKCALPTGESLLMQSLVQVFGDEFGRPCPLPCELPFHKIVDWDATPARFAYDLAYADKQPDWTYRS
jgi:hypothetical protein